MYLSELANQEVIIMSFVSTEAKRLKQQEQFLGKKILKYKVINETVETYLEILLKNRRSGH